MASRFVRDAVKELAGYIRTNLPTHLRATETAEGLAANALPDPVEVLEANLPSDHRTPLVQVFADSWSYADHRNKIVDVECTVAVSVGGDADLAALTTRADRYVTAMLLTLTASPHLDNTVIQALPTDSDRATIRGDDSLLRQVFIQGMRLQLEESAA